MVPRRRPWLLVLFVGTAAASGCSLAVSLDGYATTSDRPDADATVAVPDAGTPEVGVRVDRYVETVLADGPIGYWRLAEKSGTLAAATVGAVNGTYQGAVPFDAFAGPIFANGEYVDLGGSFGFEGTTEHSIELWVRRTTARESEFRTLLSKSDGMNDERRGWHVFLSASGEGESSPNHAVIEGYDGTTHWTALWSRTSLLAGAWYHVVFARDADGTRHVYVNGVSERTAMDPRSVTSSPASAKIASNTNGIGSPFAGQIRDVAFYGKALTSERVRIHYEAGTD